MADEYKNRQLARRIATNADQSEIKAIQKGSALAEDGFYDDKVSGATDDYANDDLGDISAWQKHDLELDSAAGDILNEITRRKDLMGESYPFQIAGAQLTYTPSRSGFYEYCLAICSAPSITSGEYVNLPRRFERVSAYLVQCFLGDNSAHMHVGTPRDSDIGSKFFDAMKKLHEATQEWVWNSMKGLPDEIESTGDEGLDFVVWKNTPDGRAGKLFVIGQCACGDDWNDKFHDLTLERIGRWFHPYTYVPPVRAFTIPYHLSDMNLLDATNQAGLVFDRARLTLIAEKIAAETEDYKSHYASIKDLTGLVLNT